MSLLGTSWVPLGPPGASRISPGPPRGSLWSPLGVPWELLGVLLVLLGALLGDQRAVKSICVNKSRRGINTR